MSDKENDYLKIEHMTYLELLDLKRTIKFANNGFIIIWGLMIMLSILLIFLYLMLPAIVTIIGSLYIRAILMESWRMNEKIILRISKLKPESAAESKIDKTE